MNGDNGTFVLGGLLPGHIILPAFSIAFNHALIVVFSHISEPYIS